MCVVWGREFVGFEVMIPLDFLIVEQRKMSSEGGKEFFAQYFNRIIKRHVYEVIK